MPVVLCGLAIYTLRALKVQVVSTHIAAMMVVIGIVVDFRLFEFLFVYYKSNEGLYSDRKNISCRLVQENAKKSLPLNSNFND